MKPEEKQAQTQVDEIKIKQTKGSEKHPSEQYYSIKTPVGTYNVKASLLPVIPKIGDAFNVCYTESKYVHEGVDTISKWVVAVEGASTSSTLKGLSGGSQADKDWLPQKDDGIEAELAKDIYAMFMVGVKCLINQEDILFPEYLTRVKIAKDMIKDEK